MKRLRAALLALCCVAPAAHAEPVELSVLTYNIHGLPSWIARDDPPARIPQILSIAQPYDVVLLQEDFAHHDAVVAASPFAHLVRGNPAWLEAPLFQGAGLTILSRFAATESAREPYDVCNGWVSAANDCFGHKGFVMARLALPDGAAIDAWNTHLDAGDTDADRAVRADQLGATRCGDRDEERGPRRRRRRRLQPALGRAARSRAARGLRRAPRTRDRGDDARRRLGLAPRLPADAGRRRIAA